MLIALWAQDQNGVIGKDGKLPWSLPNDMKFFKEQTTGNAIIMGRKTFESMGEKALPNRVNIVLTSDKDYKADQVLIFHTVEEILHYIEQHEGKYYLIGGTGIFRSMLAYCTDLYRTTIEADFEGDVYFPEELIDRNEWTLTKTIPGIMDERNHYPHIFELFTKK